ncbi:hypothetical protein CYLTODRAFT_56871 [Cylindrobasidium torrendii FP15055 ss-10]|uniref:RING-type domain-containing protein n=1 Tax=Cylindrobasidium torrendii FP15055 ss-10 TaxID=1314674 RepID=A0A0D7BQ81_9AGAR|nr:hypothetical protein CYLTODRAFT_56871 [Cylindrobasidium torrendii FP15055 ss-10]
MARASSNPPSFKCERCRTTTLTKQGCIVASHCAHLFCRSCADKNKALDNRLNKPCCRERDCNRNPSSTIEDAERGDTPGTVVVALKHRVDGLEKQVSSLEKNIRRWKRRNIKEMYKRLMEERIAHDQLRKREGSHCQAQIFFGVLCVARRVWLAAHVHLNLPSYRAYGRRFTLQR